MRVSKLPFKVIDVRTGREYSEDAVIKDGYTDGLMEMDLDGFMLCEDGHLAFGDECGRYNYANTIAKYEIEIKGYVAIDDVLAIIKDYDLYKADEDGDLVACRSEILGEIEALRGE